MSHTKAGKYSCYEFERKFLLTKLPAPLLSFKIIEDTYFKDTSLRLRIIKSPWGAIIERKLTQKRVSERNKFEETVITNIYLDEKDSVIFANVPGKKIAKKRHVFQSHGQKYAIDEFQGAKSGLVIAEIEFESVEEMRAYKCPFSDWSEVTEDPQYLGSAIAY